MVTDIRVQEAYAARAAEYTALFGSADAAHESDRLLISRWAQSLRGPAVTQAAVQGIGRHISLTTALRLRASIWFLFSLKRRELGFRGHGFEWQRSER
jgi:hypothetical protein